jgi:hypothetical protein
MFHTAVKRYRTRSADLCAVIPGQFWITSSASSALAVGLTSWAIFSPSRNQNVRNHRYRAGMDNDSDTILCEPPAAGNELDTLPRAPLTSADLAIVPANEA